MCADALVLFALNLVFKHILIVVCSSNGNSKLTAFVSPCYLDYYPNVCQSYNIYDKHYFSAVFKRYGTM